MNIRVYEQEDEQAVVSLWKTCGMVVPWNDPHKDIQRKLNIAPDLFLVGTVSNQIVATVMGGYEGHRGTINYLAVSPDYQKQGFGREMVTAIETRLQKQGCPKINLMVRETNLDVVEFYKSLGYEPESIVVFGKRLESDEKESTIE